MAMCTHDISKLVFRQYQDGRIRCFFDGQLIPGVLNVTISQPGGTRSTALIEVVGVGFKLETVDDRNPSTPAGSDR